MKRKVALALTSVMVLSIVGGCSSSDGGSKGGSGDSGDKVVMNMTTLNGGTNDVFAEALQKEIDKFNADNEYNVEIQLECYSNGFQFPAGYLLYLGGGISAALCGRR